MHHHIAFLRGINLGRRRLGMAVLCARFAEMKFTGVATFIASGNVIFASRVADRRALERRIEAHLEKSLGYAVDAFVRTRAEVAAVAAFRPFPKADFEHPEHTVAVGFLKDPLGADQARGLPALQTDVDAFRVAGREFYWLCRIKRTSESKVWTTPQMRALKLPTFTMRNLTTVRKLAALYPEPAD